MTFNADLSAARYQPRPQDAPPEVYAERLSVCQTCQNRRANSCRPAAQLCSVLARHPVANCPGVKWPGQESPREQPPAPTPSRAASSAAVAGVAVIIISHNYGRFLEESIESVLGQQLRPAEILVVDDASDDETRDVTDRYLARGVRYRRVEAREVAAARWAGLQATKSPLVVFLDADDVLGPDYLQTGIPLFADPEVGVVTSDLEQFGAISGRLHHPAGNIEATNWVHAGSIARRTALETAAPAFELRPGPWTHHDWLMWRAVHRQGWKFARSPGTYRYRKHPTSVSAGMVRERVSYFQEAGLGFETLTLFLALSGRDREFTRLTEFLRYQTWPKDQIRLVICDTSQNQSFGARLRKCLVNCEYSDWRYYRQSVGPPNLADHDRHDAKTHRNVQVAMPRIYSRAIREAGTEYLWIL
ncbi:MAG: glycosyltransferase, partial [Planctomycetaceae bacterium]